MSSPQPSVTDNSQTLNQSSMDIMSIINAQTQLDKMRVLHELMKVFDIKINIVGDEHTILNQEILTEYTSAKVTKWMVRNETWRKSVQEVYHNKDINNEKLVGYMDAQVILKMKAHRRKGSQEIINALRNEPSGTEVIPTNTRKKKFFGMV